MIVILHVHTQLCSISFFFFKTLSITTIYKFYSAYSFLPEEFLEIFVPQERESIIFFVIHTIDLLFTVFSFILFVIFFLYELKFLGQLTHGTKSDKSSSAVWPADTVVASIFTCGHLKICRSGECLIFTILDCIGVYVLNYCIRQYSIST